MSLITRDTQASQAAQAAPAAQASQDTQDRQDTQLRRGAGPSPAGRRRRTAVSMASAVLAAAVLTGAVAGCGGSSGTGGSASSAKGAADSGGSVSSGGASSGLAKAPGVAPAPGGASAAQPGGGDTTEAGSADLVQGRRLVRSSSLELTVGDIFRTAARIRAVASSAGGYVGDEKTQAAGPGQPAQSSLTLRVPQARLGSVTDQVAGLGTVAARSQSSDDVTQQSVDVTSRLATEKASVARVRVLLARATRIADIVQIEGELSQRESNLESLEAQLKSLDDSVDLATLSVTLSPPGVAKKPVKAGTGFGAGLHRGWDAFTGALVVALTVVGALLPFALLLVLVGLPALVLWRRRRTSGPASGRTGPPATPGSLATPSAEI